MNFSLRRVFAVVKIRNREFYRDLGALGWVIIFPLVMVVTFGYVFDVDKGESYKVGYWADQKMENIENIQWVKYESQEEALRKLKYQQIDMAMTVDQFPPVIWSAKRSPKSKMAKKILKLYLADSPDPYYEEEIDGKVFTYIDWVFPGIMNLNVMFMGLWGVGWVIVRQRKLGILKRFKASPLTAFEYLLAQMISRLLITLFSGVLVFSLANLIYPFNFEPRYLDFFVVFGIGAMTLSSVGLIFAARINSEELCNGLLNFITYPLMFISEIWFSLEGSPGWVKELASYSPLWRMTDSMRRILFEGQSLIDVKNDIVYMIVFGLIFTVIGAYLFKWNKE